MEQINIFSFFSGAGFLDLGFEMVSPFKVVYVNEFHKPFNDVYRYARQKMGIEEPQFGHHIGDITQLLNPDELQLLKEMVNESKAAHLTGFIGGPPCPDFSVAGKNRGREGDNGKLSGTYTEVICKIKPDFFLFENVKGLYRTARHREFFEELKEKFRKAGYSMTEQLVNALEFGAPQDRDRIILIGIHKGTIKKLGLKHKNHELLNFPWDQFKVGHLADLKALPWPTTSLYQEDVPTTIPEGLPEELTVEYWWRKNDVLNHPNGKMFFQPKAGIKRFATKDEGDDAKKCYKRLHRWRYSPTAAYGNNEVHVHPYKSRRISVAEALAIQSLPKEYELPMDITLTDAFKTIGNGVPFILANGVAKTLIEYLVNSTKHE
ncbi:MAG: DNA cytosine methyltransferase [Bacteroidales bacterium]|nr:DNA cytosine methyltransferase [Bacteroidales bacterium]